MIFTYGVFGGIGFGLVYLPSVVIVNFYFEKKRAIANGITMCGSGVGTLIFTFITEPLLDYFGWKGTMWIISGIVLNACVCVSLFRPLEVIETSNIQTNQEFIKAENIKKKITANDDTHSTGSIESKKKFL